MYLLLDDLADLLGGGGNRVADGGGCLVCLGGGLLQGDLLGKVAVQHTLQSLAVAGFVLRHFMDGVVDGVQTVLLGAGGQVKLALGGAELAVNAPGQIVLGGGLHVGLQILAQDLGELGGVLGFLVGGLLPVQADLGVALPVGNAGHAQIHADLAALALEVGHQLLEDVLLVFLGDVGVVLHGLGVDAVLMLGGQLAFLHDLELGAVNAAHGALEAFGDVFLFAGDIRSNIVLRSDNVTDEDVWQACRYVNADGFIRKLDGGLDEAVREQGNNFSAGQRQLLSFARTILHKPSVMILDEATANIDTETEVLIQDSLEKMKNIGTMLIVAHRLSTIQHADNIILLSHGEIMEQGTHQELLHLKGRYYQLYTLQFRKQQLQES